MIHSLFTHIARSWISFITLIFTSIALGIHIVLSVPLLSTYITIQSQYWILVILLFLHFASYALAIIHKKQTPYHHIVGLICTIGALIPLLDFIFHAISVLVSTLSILYTHPRVTASVVSFISPIVPRRFASLISLLKQYRYNTTHHSKQQSRTNKARNTKPDRIEITHIKKIT